MEGNVHKTSHHSVAVMQNQADVFNQDVHGASSPQTISGHLKVSNDKFRSSLHSDHESDSSEYTTSVKNYLQKQRKPSTARRLSLHRDMLMHRKLNRVGSDKRKMSERLNHGRPQNLFSSLDCGHSPSKPKNLHLGHSAPNIYYFASDRHGPKRTSSNNSFSACQISRKKSTYLMKDSPKITHIKNRRMSVNSLMSSDCSCFMSPSSAFSSVHSSQEAVNPNSENDLFWVESMDHRVYHASPTSLSRPRSQSFSLKQLEPDLNLNALNEFYRSCFPKAITEMELKLEKFLEKGRCPDFYMAIKSDGSASFVLHQLVELANDCLEKSRAQQISSNYFSEMVISMQQLIENAKTKIHSNDLALMIRELLMIISRPARLLECLEFDPKEYYKKLEQGDIKQIKNADIITYIIKKMSLDKYSDKETKNDNDSSDTSSSTSTKEGIKTSSRASQNIHLSSTENEGERVISTFSRPPQEADFETVKLISNGAYGAVHLVRHKDTKRLFAMKKLLKSDLVLRNMIDQVFAERDILTFTDNPFVVSFYCSFETKRHLCMVLEYVEGGDCGALLKNIGGPLPLDMSRLYFAETVLALEYLHSFGVVHRDLKPDNLLLTSTGHVKLTDFGLSKIGLMKMTTNLFEGSSGQFLDNQVFGTPEYIAPEVILRQGYGQTVDWWSMGVILYQFLVGCVPFTGDSAEEVFEEIISGEILWPEEEEFRVCEEARDIIESLLERDPINRLGYAGALEVREHAFFEDVDWSSLLRQKTQFVPQLMDEEDTSYFDMRLDRYCHLMDDSGGEESEKSDLFKSFSTCSPRYSRAEITIFSDKYHEVDSKAVHHDVWLDQQRGMDPLSPPLPPENSTLSCNTSLPSRTTNKSCSSLHETSLLMEKEQRLGVSKGLRPTGSLKRYREDRVNKSSSSASLFSSSTPVRNKATHRLVKQLSRDSSGSSFDDSFHECLPKVIQVTRSREGFGFSFRALKVLNELTGRYSFQHIVVHVEKNGPAHKSGLCVGDVLTHIDNNKISGWPHRQVIKLLLQQRQLSPSVNKKKLGAFSKRTKSSQAPLDIESAPDETSKQNESSSLKCLKDSKTKMEKREFQGSGSLKESIKSKTVRRSRSLKLKMMNALRKCERTEERTVWYTESPRIEADTNKQVNHIEEESESGDKIPTFVELRIMPTVKVKKTIKLMKKIPTVSFKKKTMDVLMMPKSFLSFQEKSLCRRGKYQSMNYSDSTPASSPYGVMQPGKHCANRPSSLAWGSRKESVGSAISPLVLCSPSNRSSLESKSSQSSFCGRSKLVCSFNNSPDFQNLSQVDCQLQECSQSKPQFFIEISDYQLLENPEPTTPTKVVE